MAIYLKKFENHTQYDTYINGSGAILPNVSICTTEGDVHYNPSAPPTPAETRVVAKLNVTSTSTPTRIVYYTANINSIEIDGVEQQSATTSYTFSTTGEHTVKYTLKDPTTIGEGAFNYCEDITSIYIPDSVTSIGERAFWDCAILTSCTIGSGVTSIGAAAFTNCPNLISITIPNGVTTIGSYAFSGGTSLTSVTIGSSVTSIGNSAFTNCTNLTSIISNATTAPTIGSRTFQNVKTGGTLTVPIGSTGYDVWMGTGDYYLGKYDWTKIEQ